MPVRLKWPISRIRIIRQKRKRAVSQHDKNKSDWRREQCSASTHEKEKLSHLKIQNWGKLFCKEKRWDVLTAVLCNKRCIRKLQFVVHTWTDLKKNTIHLIYGRGHFKIYRISALCSFLAATRTPLMCWILIDCSGSPELPIRVPVLGAYGHLRDTRFV